MQEMILRDVQQVCLDIMQDIHDFCVKNDIHYSLSGGSLLGAIRHNGFIPWDDDMDIQLPRKDYEKLIHSYKSEKGYRLFCREVPDSDVEWMSYPYARICDIKRTFVDTGVRPWISKDVGIWIDILPCDGMPSDMESAKKHYRDNFICEKHAYWSGMRFLPWSKIRKCYNIKQVLKFVFRKLFVLFVRQKSYEEILSVKQKYSYDNSEYFFAIPHYGMKEWQPKNNMESFILHKFEDSEFYIMSGYDANLKSLFGDYMQLPPVNKRICHRFNHYFWKD